MAFSIENEFAVVEVSVERGETGERLVLRDAASGDSIALDALELELLAHTTHETLRALISGEKG